MNVQGVNNNVEFDTKDNSESHQESPTQNLINSFLDHITKGETSKALAIVHKGDIVLLLKTRFEEMTRFSDEDEDTIKNLQKHIESYKKSIAVLKEANADLKDDLQKILVEMHRCLKGIEPVLKMSDGHDEKEGKGPGKVTMKQLVKLLPHINEVMKNFKNISFEESRRVLIKYGLLKVNQNTKLENPKVQA